MCCMPVTTHARSKGVWWVLPSPLQNCSLPSSFFAHCTAQASSGGTLYFEFPNYVALAQRDLWNTTSADTQRWNWVLCSMPGQVRPVLVCVSAKGQLYICSNHIQKNEDEPRISVWKELCSSSLQKTENWTRTLVWWKNINNDVGLCETCAICYRSNLIWKSYLWRWRWLWQQLWLEEKLWQELKIRRKQKGKLPYIWILYTLKNCSSSFLVWLYF